MNSSLELQQQIRGNAEDVRNFVSDLRNWEEEMKRKEMEMCSKPGTSKVEPPIRNNGKKRDSPDSTSDSQNAKKRISSSDYAAWEKFDVEKACEDIDSDSSEKPESEEERQLRENMMKDEANYEKERGNQFVKKGKWDSAIECYSKAIKCYSRDAIYYCNRALCYLKKKNYRAAETDCTSALALDDTYVKAFHRRGLARKELNQLDEALVDLKRALELEPNNTAVLRDFSIVDSKVQEERRIHITEDEVAEEIVLSWGLENQEPIVPAAKHRPNGTSTKSCKDSSSSKDASTLHDWPHIDGTQLIYPVQIPPHQRSKKPLIRMKIEEEPKSGRCPVEELPSVSPRTSAPECVLPTPKNTESLLRKSPSDLEENNHTTNSSCGSLNLPKRNVASKNTEKSPGLEELATVLPTFLPPPPKNSVQFFAGWRQLKGNSRLCYQYLKQIPGKELPAIFQDSLDGNILSKMIEILASEFIEAGDAVLEYVDTITRVKRFRTLTMFMSESDKKNVLKLLDYAQSKENCGADEVRRLKEEFEV